MNEISHILQTEDFTNTNLKKMLVANEVESIAIFDYAKKIKTKFVGNKVFLRGLIELSNSCEKNCFYCGIRAGHATVFRYAMPKNEVLQLVKNIYNSGLTSIVIQGGERSDKNYVDEIEYLLQKIKETTNNNIGITLSLGEQSEETYKRWKDAGAKRYLLRIETSNEELYKKLHPENHSYAKRIASLKLLKKLNYQVGTGVMIGLPFQTISDLADDLLFFKNIDIDMIGMGPYIPHVNTPLYSFSKDIPTKVQRLSLSLKMVALARIMMKDINIAATTALQTLDFYGREKAVAAGANVIMPNITPLIYRENYNLYSGKTTVGDDFDETIKALEYSLMQVGAVLASDEQGDSKHFESKRNLTAY